MQASFIKKILLLAVILLSGGCGTYLSRTKGLRSGDVSRVYPATTLDVSAMPSRFFLPAIIDLPFSLIIDTLMLPVDIYKMNSGVKITVKPMIKDVIYAYAFYNENILLTGRNKVYTISSPQLISFFREHDARIDSVTGGIYFDIDRDVGEIAGD